MSPVIYETYVKLEHAKMNSITCHTRLTHSLVTRLTRSLVELIEFGPHLSIILKGRTEYEI